MKDEGSGFAVAIVGCPLVTALFMKDSAVHLMTSNARRG